MANLAAMDPILLAQECLDELGLQQDRPIDVLVALERLELTTVVKNLGDVLGVVVPQGGVMLSSQRGETVQRYTAAHEIGHWIMHRDTLVIDTDLEVMGQPSQVRERQAQLFASYFLMPPPLLIEGLGRYGIRKNEVEPAATYLLARDLRVSYEAALVRLMAEGFLRSTDLAGLRAFGRSRAREAAFAGRRPEDGWADLWSASYQESQALEVTVGDEIVVSLPENRTTPYRWQSGPAVSRRIPRARPRPTTPMQGEDGLSGAQLAAPDSPAPVGPASRRAALAYVPTGLRSAGVGQGMARSSTEAFDARLIVRTDDFYAGHLGELVRLRRAMPQVGDPAGSSAEGASSDGRPAGGLGERVLQVQCVAEGDLDVTLVYAHAFDPDADNAASWQLTLHVVAPLAVRQRRRLLSIDIDARQPGDPADDAVF